VIFVTVGTHHQPFARLLDAVAALGRDDVVVQHGHSPPPAGVATAVAFMSFAEMEARMREAEAVVTHAGVGSILLALRCGHTPIVVARLRRHGEHVDDHQVELTEALAGRGVVVALDDTARLEAVLSPPPPRRTAAAPAEGDLHRAVRAALLA
jgi:UDP-N-acetylglucosamine transferase subunit ALG13